mgnify:CR=1 FL=1
MSSAHCGRCNKTLSIGTDNRIKRGPLPAIHWPQLLLQGASVRPGLVMAHRIGSHAVQSSGLRSTKSGGLPHGCGQAGSTSPGHRHGPAFADAFITLVGIVIGPQAALALRLSLED